MTQEFWHHHHTWACPVIGCDRRSRALRGLSARSPRIHRIPFPSSSSTPNSAKRSSGRFLFCFVRLLRKVLLNLATNASCSAARPMDSASGHMSPLDVRRIHAQLRVKFLDPTVRKCVGFAVSRPRRPLHKNCHRKFRQHALGNTGPHQLVHC